MWSAPMQTVSNGFGGKPKEFCFGAKLVVNQGSSWGGPSPPLWWSCAEPGSGQAGVCPGRAGGHRPGGEAEAGAERDGAEGCARVVLEGWPKQRARLDVLPPCRTRSKEV
uniref:Uncharacterized protein n=1 Tax=Rangifer tarandus platyrhynchus TaxID=3082113 RepID=A0ACB0DYD1_RANTA|nr:unnamed protein product [Rangifer tarandus platyrhynchus]